MEVYVNNKKLHKINIVPTTTISQLKETIKGIVSQNSYTIRLIFNNGEELSPLVFQTNTYDNINFQSHKEKIQGGQIYVNTKTTTMDVNINNQKMYQINILPTTTISQLKETIRGIVKQNNYTIRLVFNNGEELLPLVFQTNTYDNVNFQSQATIINGGQIYINIEENNLWKQRFIQQYEHILGIKEIEKNKPSDKTWEEYYNSVVMSLNQEDPFEMLSKYIETFVVYWPDISVKPTIDNLSFVVREMGYSPIKYDDLPTVYKNRFRLNNVGKKIKLALPAGLSSIDVNIIEFKTDTFFTPEKILMIIYNYYQTTLSMKEFRKNEDSLRGRITNEMVRNNQIKRLAVLSAYNFGNPGLIGLTFDDEWNAYHVILERMM